jgi:hypothetical protein
MTTETDTNVPAAKPSGGLSRRKFLAVSGMTAGVAVVAVACGSDDNNSGTEATTATTAAAGGSTTTTGGGGGGDLAIAAGAAGLEVLAVNTYGAALDAATAGDLGEVPAAVAEYATTAKMQHQAALDAWNGVLSDNGEPEVSDPPADLETTVNDAFAEVTDITGVAELALMLENVAADTYMDAQSMLEGSDAKQLAGSIQVVDRQHIAILNYVLGEYPVPDTFQNTDNSVL